MPYIALLFIFMALLASTLSFRVHGSTLSSMRLNLFDFFKGANKKDVVIKSKVSPSAIITSKAGKVLKLEKISNKQNRDWDAESRKIEANQPSAEITDKQSQSYNYKKANEFPNLYGGWIKNGGSDQIGKQMVSAVKAALGKKIKYQEVLFQPVPNLDEVAFGTVWNQRLRKEVAAELKVPDFATNRGGPSTLEWSNLYWLNRLARGLGGKKILAISISGEGTGKAKYTPTLAKGTDLVTFAEAKKLSPILRQGQYDIVLVISPCSKLHYSTCMSIGDSIGASCIALNSPYSYIYDVGGGKPFELTYVMSRIPKGWLYRAFPKKFECIIEGPSYEVFKATEYIEQPKLSVVSKASMAASSEKYGATGNDRIFAQRL